MIRTVIKGVRSDFKEDQVQPYSPIIEDLDFETFTFFRYTLGNFFKEKSTYLSPLFNLLTKRNIEGLEPNHLRNYINVHGHADGAFGFLYYPEVELLLEELKRIRSNNSQLKKFIEKEYDDKDLVDKFHKLVDNTKLIRHLEKELSKIDNGDIVICSLNKVKN